MTMLDAPPPDPKTATATASMSRLDRILAPLADLGDAIRQEVAASVMPVIAELEATRTHVLGLEARVCLLEARLTAAASALLGLPVAAAPSGADGEATRDTSRAAGDDQRDPCKRLGEVGRRLPPRACGGGHLIEIAQHHPAR